NDIAVGLRTPVSRAEELKIIEGAASCAEVSSDEYIEVISASGQVKKNIPRSSLCEVIEPREREMFSMIKNELREAGPRDLTPAGLVLTGGASLLEGTCKLASDIVELPVRLGEPEYVDGLSDIIDNPVYTKKDKQIPKPVFSTAVGLIKYGINYGPQQTGKKSMKNTEIVANFFQRLREWFEDFF
ncbi:MAG: cell division FtsA domain-containing protein, partial [Halanaerobiales bacterium]